MIEIVGRKQQLTIDFQGKVSSRKEQTWRPYPMAKSCSKMMHYCTTSFWTNADPASTRAWVRGCCYQLSYLSSQVPTGKGGNSRKRGRPGVLFFNKKTNPGWNRGNEKRQNIMKSQMPLVGPKDREKVTTPYDKKSEYYTRKQVILCVMTSKNTA